MHKRIQLDNGIVLAHQKLEGYKSVSIGVWIRVGSAYESKINNGISHFVEHMMFKGTLTRSAKDIAMAVDGVGGEINAYTAKECTCYYLKVLGENLEFGLDLLSDIVFNAAFNESHIETEKTVVLDEIAMYEDAPDELVIDLLSEVTFGKHPLSFPILGSKETVMQFTREELLKYYHRFYTPENIVVSVSGEFDEEKLLNWTRHYFCHSSQPSMHVANPSETAHFQWGVRHKKKDIEQIHVSMDFPGLSFDDALSYDMSLLSNILGGSNSSRLFQNIREDKGLAYNIYSEPSFYDALGTLNISFALSKDNLEQTLDLVFDEILNLKMNKLTIGEVEHAKQQLKGSVILGLEGSEHYMDLIGRVELFAHKEKDIQEMLLKIDNITVENVNKIIDNTFGFGHFSMAIVGDISQKASEQLFKKYTLRLNQMEEL